MTSNAFLRRLSLGFLVGLSCPSLSYNAALKRDDVVSNAQSFVTGATLSTNNLLINSAINPNFPQCDYRSFLPSVKGQIPTPFVCSGDSFAEAYKWGGFDSTSTYQSNISPGNKKIIWSSANNGTGSIKIGTQTFTVSNFTGTDCSGLVLQSWGIAQRSGFNSSNLSQLMLPVIASNMKRGDVFLHVATNASDLTGHVTLLAQDLISISGLPYFQSANIIQESNVHFPRPDPAWSAVNDTTTVLCDQFGCPRLQGLKLEMDPYSPFPQISNFQIDGNSAGGAVTNDTTPYVSATIQSATLIKQSNLDLAIDGTPVTSPSIIGGGGLVTISGTASPGLSNGSHQISITAETTDLGPVGPGLDLVDSSTVGFNIAYPFPSTTA